VEAVDGAASADVTPIKSDVSRSAPAVSVGSLVRVARQVQECLAMLADLTGNPDRQGAERDAVLLLSALVGAISMARAVNDPDLSQQILASAAAALNEHIPNHAGSRTGDDHLQTGIGRTVTPAASGELPVPLRI
jgi:hypothetical protein